MPLSSGHLANMRARADGYLVDSCIISYPTHTGDGMGGWTDAWTVRGTVSCYLQAKDVSDMSPSGDRLTTFTEYTLFITDGGTIVPGDRVELESRTYSVEGVIEEDSLRAYKAAKLTLETV
jgi:hypothetical protein